MRPIDADALVEHLERWSEDYAEIHERLKNGDVSKAVMYGKFTALVETMIDVKRMPTLDCVTQQQWISVNDRLPEEGQSVLVHYVDGWMPVAHLLNGKWYQSGGETSWLSVTHWMPLPEPPKEE